MNVLKYYECVCAVCIYVCTFVFDSALVCAVRFTTAACMYVCVYIYVRVCLRCGGLWHVLCVLYGRWQLSYGMGRVG